MVGKREKKEIKDTARDVKYTGIKNTFMNFEMNLSKFTPV